MKNYLLAFCCIFFLSCDSTTESKTSKETSVAKTTQKDCKESVAFGDIDICIPTIKGYVNIYNKEHLETKEMIKSMFPDDNQVFAYFVNDDSYENETYNTSDDSDYFSFYTPKSFKNKNSTPEDLKKIYVMQQDGFMKKGWDFMEDVYGDLLDAIDQPVLIDSYETNENFLTVVFLIKYNLEEGDKLMLGAMNYLLIDKKITHFGYYLKYNDENLEKIKQMNNYIGLKILDENN